MDNFEEVLDKLFMMKCKLEAEHKSIRDIKLSSKLSKLITEVNSFAFHQNVRYYEETYGSRDTKEN